MTDSIKSDENDGTEPTPENLQLIAKVAMDLHIARRNFMIYPDTHEQVQRSLDRTFDHMGQVFAQQSRMTLMVQKQGLAVGQNVLPSKSAVFKDMATLLKQYEIATLTFTQGLEKQELVRFLKLIVTDRDAILSQGGIDGALQRADVPHIQIQSIDYSQLQVTEERRIDRASEDRIEQVSVWQQFVDQLITVDGQPNDRSERVFNPEKLAEMLNDQSMDVTRAIDQYKHIIETDSALDDNLGALSAGLPQFQQMIKKLNPGLQSQFLASTFDQCALLDTMADTARLIDGLGGKLVLKMLKQANDQNKAISPSLLAFVKKMAHMGDGLAAEMPGAVPGGGDKGFAAAEIETLFAHEQYDQYVDSGYGELLEKMVAQTQEGAPTDTFGRIQHQVTESLTPVHVNSHVGRAMLALMRASPDIESYRSWARQLAYFLDDLLDSQAFEFMVEMMAFLNQEKEGHDPEKAKIAGLVLDRFSDPQFVAQAVEMFRGLGDQIDAHAMSFLVALGEPVVVEIFEGLDPDETFMEGDNLTARLLGNLAALTTQEAIARFDDPRPEYVRRMIRIVSRLGDDRIAEQVKLLLDHDDPDIRMEALSALLKLRNKWGLIQLRHMLSDPKTPEFVAAIELAGRHKVFEAVPQLVACAGRNRDLKCQEAVLRALGNIGDPRAIPILTKLASRRWSISKKNRQHIQRVLFDTLAGYPHDEIKPLLHMGLKQKDAVIKATCEQVLKKWLSQSSETAS